MSRYDDEYSTCDRTYATLRVYPGGVTPNEVTRLLGIQPTKSQLESPAGERLHGWFLSSNGRVESRDVRRHIDWVLDQIEPAAQQFTALLSGGAKADMSCYWLSATGHGGPTLSPGQMSRLANLGVDCWFDVYSGD